MIEPDLPPRPPLRISCQYTLTDVLESMAVIRKRLRRRVLPLFAVYIACVVAVIWWRLQAPPANTYTTGPAQPDDGWLALLPWVVMMVVVFTVAFWWRRQLTKRQFKYFGPLQRPHTFEFQADLVLIHEPLARHEYHWDAFDRTAETRSLFLLFVNEMGAHLVTKRSFADEQQVAVFRDLLKAKIDPSKSARQAFPVIPVANVASKPSQDGSTK